MPAGALECFIPVSPWFRVSPAFEKTLFIVRFPSRALNPKTVAASLENVMQRERR